MPISIQQHVRVLLVLSIVYEDYQDPPTSWAKDHGYDCVEVPTEYLQQTEKFIEEHGYLTHTRLTEYSVRGRTYINIYGKY